MIPTLASVLNGIARTLLMDLVPQTADPYQQQVLQLGAALAMMCAQEVDRAAARLIEENAALAALCADAEPAVTDAALRAALRTAAGAAPTGFLLTQLGERNRTLRATLIRLHEHVETRPELAALDARIWAELAESTRRRQLDMAMPG